MEGDDPVVRTAALDALGVELLRAPKAGCCGALRTHLSDPEGGLADMRRNVDAWWPLVSAGKVEAIVMNASACGATVKDYGHALAHDPAYAERARAYQQRNTDFTQAFAMDRMIGGCEALLANAAR